MIASCKNFLLVGNSRLHWASKLENETTFFHTQKINNVPKNINLDDLIWASVGDLPQFFLKKENEIETSEIKLDNLPNFFGIDRALGCVAALKIIENPRKRNLLIADFGTTLSITKLTADGKIIGGQIIPGFITQLKSMEQNTRNLTIPKKQYIPNNNFSIKTQDAMLKGVFNSLIGAINLSFDPNSDILIICGGDSELISDSLNKNESIIVEPNLVMIGMIEHNQTSI